MARYAEHTDVSVEGSRAELDRLLRTYKAKATAFFNAEDQAAVAFEMRERRVLFKLPLPSRNDKAFTHGRVNQSGSLKRLSDSQAETRWEKACRRKWRALVLAIKAKLVSVEEGVESFEDAFMAHVVMPDGQTVADHVRPRIASAYKENKMQPLLPGPSSP